MLLFVYFFSSRSPKIIFFPPKYVYGYELRRYNNLIFVGVKALCLIGLVVGFFIRNQKKILYLI